MASFTLKLNFFLITAVIASLLIVGIGFARDNPYLTSQYLKLQLQTVWYKIIFLTLAEEKSEGNAQDIPVLLYHGLVTGSDGSNTPNEHFKDQMAALKRAGYQTITLQELYQFLRDGKELPAKSIVITFDDGRKDSYYGADPVLAALGYKASMFIITKQSLSSNSQYYLTEAEVRQMLATGRWEIGSHGENAHEFYPIDATGKTGHFFSNKLWLNDKGRVENENEFTTRITADLTNSKRGIEDTFGVKIIGFAFPFGNFGFPTENFPGSEEIVIKKAKEIYPLSFYQFATGQRFNSNYRNHFDGEELNFFIKRIEVEADWTGEDLLRVVENASSKPLPYEDNFKKNKGWIKTWGEINLSEGGLEMHPVAGDTGSAAILDGTGSWENYEFSALISGMQGSNLYLWARFMNDDNFVACNFGRDRVQIEQVFKGNKHVIKGDLGNTLPQGEFRVSVRVDERKVGCYLNGRLTVQSEFLDPSLEVGGIGIKGWDNRENISRLLVKEIQVTTATSVSVSNEQVKTVPTNSLQATSTESKGERRKRRSFIRDLLDY